MTTMDTETEYLPPRQFARLVGVSESTLAKQRMRGDGPPYVKIGRSVRYSRNVGLAWIGGHTRRSTSDNAVAERPRKRGNAARSPQKQT
jgi:predicted DNA-binding transcriptional regulator AlpA